jgi:hypothetical protein
MVNIEQFVKTLEKLNGRLLTFKVEKVSFSFGNILLIYL